ncbi:MmcB family DNA repair protein [Pseudomonas sp. GX19020]|uniref:MmcB family DNA repair protein n=1 Tax=Pseudomonas sp. GX19020 TaxID=2942277 RepID=UPI00201A10B8|nr:MmcB family DNA repair protein [Pseudomonas sp. GX19020]MCL4065560.1 MmcB family DNA repair protein [Pseudomonas sp. GX19020]
MDESLHRLALAEISEDTRDLLPMQAGQRIARGVARLLCSHGFAPVVEMPLAGKLRADVMAIGPKGEVWIVECKSCRADFRADRKWQGYTAWCDRFFWAVGPDFPQDILPENDGLILADAFGGEIIRLADETPLAPARRKVVSRDFARYAALRLLALRDPAP